MIVLISIVTSTPAVKKATCSAYTMKFITTQFIFRTVPYRVVSLVVEVVLLRVRLLR